MANLLAKTAFESLLPIEAGGMRMVETTYPAITSLSPFKGQAASVSQALTAQIGAGLPDPGQSTASAGARVIWTGLGQVFVLGPVLEPIAGAAVTDQSDAWASFALEGTAVEAVLARLVPADLRLSHVPVDHVARTLLGHMSCVLLRTAEDRFEGLVFRSMAGTAAHELERAMTSVAARSARSV